MTTIEDIKKYQGSSIQLRSELNLHIRFLLDAIAQRDKNITRSCGCITCICEDEERCHGCGAKSCKLHDRLFRERDTARAAIAQLDKEAEDCIITANKWERYATTCQEQRDTARAALRKYGRCLHTCDSYKGLVPKNWPVGGVYPCTCGLAEALK